ncbi:MAG: 23S rRNA (adenine(2030)-N(6))-methyltransferase RlmJ [Betaproteobacteria bacterium]
MLSYRHGFHAGNHADVLKHVVLLRLLRHMKRKDKPLLFVDTHAGAGSYALDSGFAAKNAEFESGIARLWQRADLPEVVADYVAAVRTLNPDGMLQRYPGSPRIAADALRATDHLRLYELHSTESALLQQEFSEAGRRVRVDAGDGFAGLAAVLPPLSRRGLVLIDPSYEVGTDYRAVLTALRGGLERFATGTYVVWYPMLARREAQELPARLVRAAGTDYLHVALQVQAPSPERFGLHGSGLVVVNPPWKSAEEIGAVMPFLTEALAQDAAARYVFDVRET